MEPDTRSAATTCLHCGHKLDHLVKEIEDELLERCPTCDAYQWDPEPIVGNVMTLGTEPGTFIAVELA
jgi:NAD-dependent SIR2 family protein deacetylase